MSVSSPLRVMQVVLSLNPGGTERLVIDIVKSLRGQVVSTVCCLDDPGAWAPELTVTGTDVVGLGRRPGFHPALGRRIARLAADRQVEVLHCHHYSPFVYGQIAALANSRLRLVFTEHGRLSDAPPSLKRRVLNPILGRLPSAIVAVSHDLKRYMVSEGLPEGRVRVIHNGIDPGTRPSAAERRRVRSEFGFAADEVVIGTVGRLDPVKDLPTLVDAIRITSEAHRSIRLLIVGDGAERARLESTARDLGVGPLVTFAGYRSDARALLAGLDLYANSSIHEGVSLTVLEAMAAGLPVVATRVGGTPEVVSADTGILVESRNAVQLAAAIASLIDDPVRRTALGEAGRARVEREFSVDAMVANYMRAYRRAAES